MGGYFSLGSSPPCQWTLATALIPIAVEYTERSITANCLKISENLSCFSFGDVYDFMLINIRNRKKKGAAHHFSLSLSKKKIEIQLVL